GVRRGAGCRHGACYACREMGDIMKAAIFLVGVLLAGCPTPGPGDGGTPAELGAGPDLAGVEADLLATGDMTPAGDLGGAGDMVCAPIFNGVTVPPGGSGPGCPAGGCKPPAL